MAFILLRLFYFIYFLGSAVILYNLISQMLFSKQSVDSSFVLSRLGLAILWPLALFSRPGRKKIFKLVRRI